MLRPQLLIASIGLMFVPILDAAIKGSAVLLLAGLVCLVLRRDSAATRHLVWTTAVILLLAMPLLSLLLPQWRVLPNWPQVSPAVETSNLSETRLIDTVPYSIESPQPQEFPWSVAGDSDPVVLPPDMKPDLVEPAPTVPSESEAPPEPGLFVQFAARPAALISLVWLAGCALVLARLFVAIVFQRRSARRCVLLSAEDGDPSAEQDDRCLGECEVLAALENCKFQMRIKRPVQLLLDPRQSMPVVWGLMRVRLRLPAEAVKWSSERQQSVLMHELAHVRRNDLVILMMTHLACALNWFNPLMWLAAWSLHVERERACDDLVLSMGIRPSTYAGHLVEVVSRLRPAEWAQSCGLAMARKSSLESRLTAVLSGHINRRGLTRLLVAAVFVIGTGIAIPVAMLHATEDKQEKAEVDEKPNEENLPKPAESIKLAPALEAKLQWGETTNGLRAALVRPQALGKPAAEEIFDFRFVVQNVSDAPIRLSTASVAPTRRYLIFRERGASLSAIVDDKPTRADFLIRPWEVAVLRMLSVRTEGDSVTTGNPTMTYAAEFQIDDAPEGSWTGKLVAAEMQAAAAGYGLLPENEDAQELFIIWGEAARRNGMIPGGMIDLLVDGVKTFTEYNPTWPTTPKLLEMLPRLDATRDWSGPEAIAILDEFARVQDSPIKMAADKEPERRLHTGTLLPPSLEGAPWGEAQTNGLRLAYLFEPPAKEHPLNTALKGRILIHNSGKNAVVFRTSNWHQVSHTATVNDSVELELSGTSWTTIGRFTPYRLAPGEYVELYATGIGIGQRENVDDWRNSQVGVWIDLRAGEKVTIGTAPIPFYDANDDPQRFGESPWWSELIKSRLARCQPFPDSEEERSYLLYRVALDLFGTPVGADIVGSFVDDREPTALDSLAQRLHDRPGTIPFTGSLTSGPTTFRVLPADPDAAKKPRTVHNPGRYKLAAEKIYLTITRRPAGERIVNEAQIRFFDSELVPLPKSEGDEVVTSNPYKFKLPGGYNTWTVSWKSEQTTLWLQEQSGYRKIDYGNPRRVVEETVGADQVPDDIRASLQEALDAAAPFHPPTSPEAAEVRP